MPRAKLLSVARFQPGTHPPNVKPGGQAREARDALAQRRLNVNSKTTFISSLEWKSDAGRRSWPYVSNPQRWSDDSKFVKPGTDEDMVIAVKDNFTSKELPTTCASLMLEGFTTPYSSTVATLLKKDGFRLLGKTNMDEFGMGSHSLNSAWGPVTLGRNRHALSVGGSSGGSALAVAQNLVRAAVGSDTGGSVRLPAAYTNTVGFKPSYGRVSRNGLIPYANSLDTVGVIADSVYNAAMLYKVLDRPDYHDPTCLSAPSRLRIQAVRQSRLGAHPSTVDLDEDFYTPVEGTLVAASTEHKTRIGVPSEYMIDELHPLVKKAWRRLIALLRQLGNTIVPISLPTTKMALAAYYIIAPAEASSNLAKYDGVRYGAPRSAEHAENEGGTLYARHRGDKFGDEVQRRILLGTFSLSATAMDNYFIQAQKVRRLVQDDFNNAFAMTHPLLQKDTGGDGVDFIIVPTAPNLPPTLSDLSKQSPLDEYMNDVFTVPASLAGLPAISVPAIYDENIPLRRGDSIGLQIIGQYGDDYSVLNFALNQVEPLMQNMPPVNSERKWAS